MSGLPSFSRSFIGGAISSAASPLQNSFIGCRSPVTPRRPSRHDRDQPPKSLHIDTDRARYSPYLHTARVLPTTSTSISSGNAYSAGIQIVEVDDADAQSSATLVSATGIPSQLLPRTPQLFPSTNGSYVDPDQGKLGTFSAINIIIGKTVGVGVYSVPSSIFVGVGSVGMSILMWVLGAIISYCGLAVYLDLGTSIPRSGGERVYLERIFRKPKMLASCMFMAYVVLLGFSTPNCIVLGEYVMYAFGIEMNRWNVRTIAVITITLLCIIHARYQRLGLRIINVLGVSKMLILVIVVLAGLASMALGVGRQESKLFDRRLSPDYMLSTAERNFSNIWAGSSTQPYDYATALLKVLYCFRGYSTANQVLSEVRNPVRTLRLAAPIALTLVSAGYILANIAYFLAVEKDDFRQAGVVVAGHFFKNVFGDIFGERVLPCFIIISAFGNIAATSFAQARVNQELAKDDLLPFATFFSGSNNESTPTRGLFLHWLISVLVIVVPPPGEIYNFLVDIGGYPVSVISVAISAGLLYLRHTPSENWSSPYVAKKVYTIIFLISNCFLLIFPWIKPKQGKGDGRFPYYAYPATALAILASGVVYWVWWSKVKPMFEGSERPRGRNQYQFGKSFKRSGALAMRRLNKYEKRSRSTEQRESLLDGPYNDDFEMVKSTNEEATGFRKRAPCGCSVVHEVMKDDFIISPGLSDQGMGL